MSALPPSRRVLGLGAIVAVGFAVATSLAGSQALATGDAPERVNVRLSDRENSAAWGIPDVRFFSDSVDGYRRALGSARTIAEEPWLALSGGGDNGAYGAGLLVGWTEAGDRPVFSVVTGISTGALIAPFAFAGPRYDGLLRDCYTTVTAADIFEFGETKESLLDTWPLAKMIERQVTPELLADIAAEHRRGRRLFIQTTNVDAERGIVWNIGAIAQRADAAAVKLVRQILLASASIPGIFPPVYIEADAQGRSLTEMHVDGGVTTPFFVGPEAVVLGARPGIVPARQVYVIVNNQVAPDFTVTPGMMLTVLGRSLSGAVKAASRAAVALHRTFAAETGLDLRVATVGSDFRAPSVSPFDPGTMQALFAYGAAQAHGRSAFLAQDRGSPLAEARR